MGPKIDTKVARVAPLVVASGACALVYQTVWLRELRLVFGASTAASAAVLAVFLGGLGAGGLVLGPRADRSPRPLVLYARLELAVAALAAASPALLRAAHALYTSLGGSAALGAFASTALRLVLTGFVLGPPTFLMGGTLPAAARAAEADDDPARHAIALLYGANTLGAVAGASLSTLVLFEALGVRATLWAAAGANALVGLFALAVAGLRAPPRVARPAVPGEVVEAAAPPAFVVAASACVGFAFLLMELVWYRMLAPLLGGSSYTFGLLLAVVLFGVGLGGLARAFVGGSRGPSLAGFALTCALEAACLALPFALGDRIALLALFSRAFGAVGFGGHALGWLVVIALVTLPAAFVSGVQFPQLVALLGRGGRDAGRHVGLAYAWNTLGAIVGSLAGGFGMLPLLGALGTWRFAVVVLVGVALVAVVLARRRAEAGAAATSAGVVAAVAVACLAARGPTAVWRHGEIGVGRATATLRDATPRDVARWMSASRRDVRWEADGVESSIALADGTSYAFVVNGKSDGSARGDAGTQVMGGLLGALLHRDARSAFVIGLGTGSTAGWLGAVPSIDRVDVVELEPAMMEVARAFAPVTHDALANPKLHVHFDDAREVLLATKARYDIVFSEPSNPYRAGISSLFTADFYRAVVPRLAEGGLFLQWLQAYDIDATTTRTAIATLASVFPSVEVWTTNSGDLLLVATASPEPIDVDRLRARIAIEPYRSALAATWRVSDAEGVLARFVARGSLAKAMLEAVGEVSTDDANLLELGFARGVASSSRFEVDDLFALARARGEDLPTARGSFDLAKLEEARAVREAPFEQPSRLAPKLASPGQAARLAAYASFLARDLAGVRKAWSTQPRPPESPFELEMVGEALAEARDPEARVLAERLRAFHPLDADLVVARLAFAEGRTDDAAALLQGAFVRARSEPWALVPTLARSLDVSVALAEANPALGERLAAALSEPFAVHLIEEHRRATLLRLVQRTGFEKGCAAVFALYEPNPVIEPSFLRHRAACYAAVGHPLAERAEGEAATWLRAEGASLGEGLGQPVRP